MNGLFSRTPSPAAVRSLLGIALLGLVEAILILFLPDVPRLLRFAAAILILLSLIAIVAGMRGDRPDRPRR